MGSWLVQITHCDCFQVTSKKLLSASMERCPELGLVKHVRAIGSFCTEGLPTLPYFLIDWSRHEKLCCGKPFLSQPFFSEGVLDCIWNERETMLQPGLIYTTACAEGAIWVVRHSKHRCMLCSTCWTTALAMPTASNSGSIASYLIQCGQGRSSYSSHVPPPFST